MAQPTATLPEDERIQKGYDKRLQSTSTGLRDAENASTDDMSDYERSFDNPTENSQEDANIDRARDNIADREARGDPTRAINHTSTVGQKVAKAAKGAAAGKGPVAFVRRRGAIIGVATLLGVGGAAISLPQTIMPFQIAALIKDKVGQLSNSTETIRSQSSLKSRLFSDGASATSLRCSAGIKLFCSYSSMTKDQMTALSEDGLSLFDKKGKLVVPDSNGHYKGGVELRSSDGKLKINAGNYTSAYNDVSNSSFRKTMNKVFPSTYTLARDKISTGVKGALGLTEDPNWANTDKETDPAKKDVAMEKDLQAAEKAGTTPSVDAGDLTQSVDDEAKSLEQNLADGKVNQPLANDLASVVNLPEPKVGVGTKILNEVTGFLNPLDIANTVCSGHQSAQKIVRAAKLIGTLYTMRVALQYISTIDKVMAGEGDMSEVQALGDSLTKTDQYGDSFGDSVGYSDIAYNKPTNKTVSIGTSGTGVLAIFTSYLTFLSANKLLGTVNNGCAVATNLVTQILASTAGAALDVVGIIFTGGSATAGKIAAEEAAKQGVKALIKDAIKSLVEDVTKKLSKDAIKDTIQRATKSAVKNAASMTGSLLVGYLAERYFVPYMAHLAAGTLFTGNENGVVMMDTLVGGMGAYAAKNNLKRGMQALTPAQYKKSLAATAPYQAQYIADQRADKSPFDATSPYTALGSIVFQFNSSLAGLNITGNGSISKASSTLASLLNPGNLLSLFGTKAGAISSTDVDALMAQSEDTDLKSMGLAVDSYGNPIVGFPDMTEVQDLTPADVALQMYDSKQVDDNGDPVSGSHYETFKTECIDATDDKQISSILPTEDSLPANCTDEATNSTAQVQLFRLYAFDHPMMDAMDNGIQSTAVTTTAIANTSIVGDDYKQDSTTYAYGSRQCVDFVLYRLVKHGVLPGIQALGNGKDVVGTLGGLGFKVDTTPALHAVMSTADTSQPSLGHTAMVAGVNADGSFTVEEYNYTRTLQYDTRVIPASDIAAKHITFAHTETKYK